MNKNENGLIILILNYSNELLSYLNLEEINNL